MKILIVNLLTLFIVAGAVGGEKRYVVSGRTAGGTILDSYPIWTDASWPRSCTRAFISGTPAQQREFCEDGFAGLKPKVGTVIAGDEVELLDTRQCGGMASVRVLTGQANGSTGCIVANALSSFKPSPLTSSAPAPVAPVVASPPAPSFPDDRLQPPQPPPQVQQPITAGTAFRWEDADKIQNGMTESDVVAILGKPYSRSQSGAHSTLVWSYTSTADGGKGKAIAFSLRDGRVIGNAATGR